MNTGNYEAYSKHNTDIALKLRHKKLFEGNTVVITGASAGVGRATAVAFAKEGAHLALIARDMDRLEETKQEVERYGIRAVIFPEDVADAAAVERSAEAIEKELGPIDIWVNNAMASVFSPVKQMTAEDYHRVLHVTFLGVVNGTLAALKRMLARDRGVIIQIGSALAYRGIPLQSAYCAAKHAIKGFHDSLRAELIHDESDVHTTMIQLPALNTPQFEWVKSRLKHRAKPLGKIFQPEVAAEAILWSAQSLTQPSHRRRELYVGSPTWFTIIGNKFFPTFLDTYLARTAYEAQETDEPESPTRPNDVWEPVHGGHFGAHGRFDAQAHNGSMHLWITTHREIIAMVLVAIALLFAIT